MIEIFKFGGASVKDAAAIQNVANILKTFAQLNPVVVISAMGKTTNALGKFMRKTRIDELPQAWNMLKGDMNLIGPRPERPVFIEQLNESIPFSQRET